MQHMDVTRSRATRRAGFAAAVAGLVVALSACQPGTSAPPPTVPLPAGATVVDVSPPGGDLFLESEVGSPSIVLYDRLTGAGGNVWLYDDSTQTSVDLGIPFSSPASATADGRIVVYSSTDPALQNGPVALNCKAQTSPAAPLLPSYCSELYLLDRTDGTTRPLTGITGSSTVSNVAPVVSPDGSTVTYWTTVGSWGAATVHLMMDVMTGAITPAPPEPNPHAWAYGQYQLEWTGADGLVRTDTVSGDVEQLSPGGNNVPWDRSADGRYVVMGSYASGFVVLDVADRSERSIPVPFINDDATRYVGVLYVDSPAVDRLIAGDLAPES